MSKDKREAIDSIRGAASISPSITFGDAESVARERRMHDAVERMVGAWEIDRRRPEEPMLELPIRRR